MDHAAESCSALFSNVVRPKKMKKLCISHFPVIFHIYLGQNHWLFPAVYTLK